MHVQVLADAALRRFPQRLYVAYQYALTTGINDVAALKVVEHELLLIALHTGPSVAGHLVHRSIELRDLRLHRRITYITLDKAALVRHRGHVAHLFAVVVHEFYGG